MYLRKAQVSVFIIVGMFILFITVFLIIVPSDDSVEEKIIESNINEESDITTNIKQFLDNCYSNSYYNTLRNIGFHGGYYLVNEDVPQDLDNVKGLEGYRFTPFAVDSISIIPDDKILETQFEAGILYEFFTCIEKQYYGEFMFSVNNSQVEVNIVEDTINTNANIPVNINYNGKEITYSSFKLKDDFSYLQTYFELSEEIIEIAIKNPYYTCLTCLDNLAVDNNIEIYNEQIIYNESLIFVIYYLLNENVEHNDAKVFSFMHIINKGGDYDE